MEQFKSRFQDEILNIELLTSLLEAKLLAKHHRVDTTPTDHIGLSRGALAPERHPAVNSSRPNLQTSVELD